MIQEQRPYRVLCLDGGGMRGLYAASVLTTLSQRFSSNGKELDIGKGFDLIAGTSTGGILACGLAAGISLSQVVDLYRQHGPRIFKHSLPPSKLRQFFWALRHLCAPANQNDHLRKSLQEIFGFETVGDFFTRRQIGLCLPAVNLSTHESRVFKTAHDPNRNADDNRRLIDICLATSAAPIILPIANIDNPHIANQTSYFVDGGLWANNPVLVGLIEALHVTDPNRDIEIVSIGTCPPPSGVTITPKEAKRGVLGWSVGIKALELSMDAQASGHHFMAKFLVEHLRKCGRTINLLRFEQSAPSSDQAIHLGLDNASERACSTLVELGNADALKIYGKSLDSESPYKLLQSIFQSMPILNTSKEKK